VPGRQFVCLVHAGFPPVDHREPVAVDYTAWADTFAEPGLVSIMPFLGVTLYVYDETGN